MATASSGAGVDPSGTAAPARLPYNSTLTPEQLETFRQLKMRVLKCIELDKALPNLTESDGPHCPSDFDGYLCWLRTKAGQTVYQQCPDFVTGFVSTRIGHKTCLPDGTWEVHPETLQSWSNYTNCIDVPDFEFRTFVNNLYVAGYAISLVTLLISLIVFLSIRSLKCTRNRVHINLFLSLALSDMLWIVWYRHVVPETNVQRENATWCIWLHLTLQYLTLTTYLWMFCEGLHLHLVLVVVFVRDKAAMIWFLIIGWVVPFIIVAIYGTARAFHAVDRLQCWMEDSNMMWILIVPVFVSLIASMVFLINALRVLVMKLNNNSMNQAPLSIRKAARAMLILVPLFGLQHLLLLYIPPTGSLGEKIYQIASALLVSLQGLCVSCLFCFANQDVQMAVDSELAKRFPKCRTARDWGNQSSIYRPQTTQSRDVI